MMSDFTLYFLSVIAQVGLHLTGDLNTSVHLHSHKKKSLYQDKNLIKVRIFALMQETLLLFLTCRYMRHYINLRNFSKYFIENISMTAHVCCFY